jgi:TP901 family phage tail tape measure protein
MQLVENSVWNLDINGKPALNALGELEQKLADTKKAQGELQRGTKEWAESQKDIKALDAEIKQVRETMGQAGMTVNQLKGYAKQLGKEILDLTPGTDEYIKKTEELQQVNTRLAAVRKDVRAVADEAEGTRSTWGKVKEWIMGAFVMTAAFEAGQMIKQFIGDAVENFKKFQTASTELSKNTKITGSELKYLEDQAKTLGPQMGRTGAEMLEAYQLMGSAKSDLTENAALLASVTKEAMILAQAGKIELAPATDIMAGALNQFNAPASDAGRFINAIAAGAQVGGAEISDMTGALKASGTVANAANVSFEQTNGALQSLSTIYIKGEQAGTMFRNVLIKLMSSTDDLNPQIVGLDQSLENLGKQNLTTAQLAKMFGTENVVAAQHLVTHRGQVKEFTTALTGTDEAYKMAAASTETLEFKQKQMAAAMANSGVKLGEVLAPALIGFYNMLMKTGLPALETTIQGFAALVKGIMAIPEFVSENKEAFIALGVALVSLNTANIAAAASSLAHAAVEKGRLIWTESATVAQWAMNAAMSANPIGLVVAAVALFVGGLITLYKNFENVRLVIDGVWDNVKRLGSALGSFFGLLGDEHAKSLAQQKNANQKHLDDRTTGEKKTAAQIAADANAANQKKLADDAKSEEAARQAQANAAKSAKAAELAAKAKANEEHRKAEVLKENEAAKRIADQQIDATEKANKEIEKMAIDAIADETRRKKAQLEYELNEKLLANIKSKADDLVKVNYEIALRAKFKTDTEKLEADAREKKVAEEKKKNDEISKIETTARSERQTREFETSKSILENALSNERLSISQRQKLKLDLIELERRNEIQRIEDIAAKERANAIETSNQLIKLAGDDSAKKKQILNELDSTTRGIDAKLVADKTATNNKYNADTKAAEQKTLEERKANQTSFFNAIKALMNGDLGTFMDYLSKKLMGDKEMNQERLRNWTTKGAEILGIVGKGVEAMMELNQKYLESQIDKNNKERNDKILKLQQQYQKGLIDKAQYETGIRNINEQADAKEKDLKMRAWKRDQAGQIAMAVINAAAAALKSLATMGFPLGLVGVAGAAGIAAIQIANIKRQQPPTFADGGYLRNGGVPQGSRHGSQYGQSGIALVDRATGEEKGEMEGGEPIMILSRNTYRNNGRVIDRLLDSSLHRNGAPVFAEKGSVFGGDGGSYQDYLEPIQNGQMYLFGSKKRKAYDAKMKAQYDADMKAKAEMESYQNMDYSAMGYDSGSYDGGASGGFDSGVDFGGGDFGDEGYNGNDYADVGEAGAIVSATSNEIAKSQNLMLAIVKNTQITAEAIRMLADITSSMSGKIDGLVGATHSVAAASNRAADAGYQAAAASNRAADVASMGKQHDA